jgi:FtsP/CotA-like multicopper oxidase with cupredoxin domain
VTTAQLILVDLGVTVFTSALWVAASLLLAGRKQPSAGRARAALGCITLAVAGLIVQIELSMTLGENGWWFAQEKLVFCLPIGAATTVLAVAVAAPSVLAAATSVTTAPVPTAQRAARGVPATRPVTPLVPAVLMMAGSASAAGITARVVVGFPMTPLPAVVLVALVVLVGWVTLLAVARSGWMPVAGTGALMVLVFVSSVGVARQQSLESAASPTLALPGIQTGTSITELRAPATDAPVRRFDLHARRDTTTVAGHTENTVSFGSLPGPELRVTQGEVVEVTLHNTDVPEGVTLHWHGYPVPGGDDGVAGVTQNAVAPGESFVYRFVATDPGTYWYHTHTNNAESIERGLFGTFVVLPPGGIPESVDITLAQHTLAGTVFLGNSDRPLRRPVTEGDTVRVRLVNTDPVPARFRIAGADFVVAAIDGHDIAGATEVDGSAIRLPSGGRADVTFVVPRSGVRVTSDAAGLTDLTLTAGSATPPPTNRAAPDLNLLTYGTPSVAAVPPGSGLIDAEMVLERLPRFLRGSPNTLTTVGGEIAPYIPAIEVREGNSVRLTVVNRGFGIHSLHVHGHTVRVVARNGRPATGAPLLLDSFDVRPGEVVEVGFVADNPGIWTDRAESAAPTGTDADGSSPTSSDEAPAEASELLTIVYRGVTSPFRDEFSGGPD